MKLLYIILLSLFSLVSYSQEYNKLDTTWVLNYNKATKLVDTIKVLQKTSELLRAQIKVLDSITTVSDLKIAKLETLDSIHRLEIQKREELTEMFRKKLINSNDIMNAYKIIAIVSEDKLQIEKKNTKKETIWKNIYKYGYPIAGIITLILLKTY